MEDLYVMPEYRGVYTSSISWRVLSKMQNSVISVYSTGKGMGKALIATVAKVSF